MSSRRNPALQPRARFAFFALLALLALACASSVALADEPKPAAPKPATPAPAPTQAKPTAGPPKPAACRPSGGVLFEIDHRADAGAKLATSTTKVYSNGAWTRDELDADGKALPQKAGCYAKADVEKLKTTLSGAEWKVTTSQVHCMAVSPTYVVYQVNGKPVFTRKLCSGQDLDEKSRTKLMAAIDQVEGTVPATTE
jgi:hypothetical protein